MKISNSKLYQKNNQRLIPETQKKAIIVSFNFGASQCDIYFLDNPQTIIRGVPLSDPASNFLESTAYLNPGVPINKRCVVDIFDESNASQMVVAYTY